MSKTSKKRSFYEDLKAGLEEGIRFLRGEISLRTYEIPCAPPPMSPKEIIALRERCQMPRTSSGICSTCR